MKLLDLLESLTEDDTQPAGPVKLYHLTNKAKFKLDPNYAPLDNSFAIYDRSGQKGIYLTRNVEKWVNGYGYVRPFVAEIHADPSALEHDTVGRWGGEKFIPAHQFDKLKVHRVVPLDAIAREEYGQHGRIEGSHGHEFDTGKEITDKAAWEYPFRGYTYDGDVRNMSPDEVKRLKQHFKVGYKARRVSESADPTAALTAWFRQSKVVDGQGKPLVCYHGTDAEFTQFDRSKARSGPSKFGFWFTADKDLAEIFGPRQMACYLRIDNPAVISMEKWNAIRDQHAKDDAWFAAWRDQLRARGHDGLIVRGGTAYPNSPHLSFKEGDHFAVFEPTQIKAVSSTGFNDASHDINEGAPEIDLPEIIQQEIAKTGFDDPEEVNDGWCGHLADHVLRRLGVGDVRGANDIARIRSAAELGPNYPAHEWVEYQGRHYDAENPEGVDDPRRFRYFQRMISQRPKTA